MKLLQPNIPNSFVNSTINNKTFLIYWWVIAFATYCCSLWHQSSFGKYTQKNIWHNPSDLKRPWWQWFGNAWSKNKPTHGKPWWMLEYPEPVAGKRLPRTPSPLIGIQDVTTHQSFNGDWDMLLSDEILTLHLADDLFTTREVYVIGKEGTLEVIMGRDSDFAMLKPMC